MLDGKSKAEECEWDGKHSGKIQQGKSVGGKSVCMNIQNCKSMHDVKEASECRWMPN